MSRAIGIDDATLAALPNYTTSPAFGPVERLVLDLAVAMSRSPVDVPAELMARLREHFDEAALVELAAAIAWEQYRARFNRVFRLGPAGFSDGSFCVLPER